MKLYLVRHGETNLNLDGVYYGWTDCDINKKGIEQATYAARYFKKIPIDVVISSDLFRAKHTAQIIAKEKELSVLEEKSFREIHFGDWENKHFKFIEKNDTENWKTWCNDWENTSFPNGESFQKFYKRVTNGLYNLIEQYKNKTVLLVSHNGALSVILCELTGAGQQNFWKFKVLQEAYSFISIENGNIVIEKINSSF